jgi:hypothetical protein
LSRIVKKLFPRRGEGSDATSTSAVTGTGSEEFKELTKAAAVRPS